MTVVIAASIGKRVVKANTLRNISWIFWLTAACPCSAGAAQQSGDSSPKPAAAAAQQPARPAEPTLRLTLDDALIRARQNSPQFQAALAEAQIAHEDTKQAKDALLPAITYDNQILYTQGNGTGSVRYIANNAVHEYISQGNVHEVLSVAGIYDVRRASAGAALARARAEIASRGLVVTVVQSYFGALAAQSKANLAQKADEEGQQFLKLTQNLERGGEVAHSDVVKAERS